MKLYVIITLLVILLIILFYNVYNESFANLPKPVTVNTPVRVDFTCPSSDQKNIFDRFDYATKSISNICPSNYTKINNYFGISNLCLPNCPSGYTVSSNDITLCIANVCYNTPDLSENILNSWRNTCSVIYKNQYSLASTIASISTVSRSFNNQFTIVNSQYTDLNTTLSGFNCSINPAKCQIRDRHMRDIGSNYTILNSLTQDINSNYIYLSNRKNVYDRIYYDLLCDRYI
uniref:Uncharacterized protein n=1 Tax=viral metagenome TaxID=1070528 RepID=A0A6C0DA44_9ZZZZ